MSAPAQQPLHRLPLDTLRGVGAKNRERLENLGIHSVQDLLFHLPLRYQDRSRVCPMGELRHGDHVLVEGEVTLSEIRHGRRRALMVQLSDPSGAIYLRFFHFSKAQAQGLTRGTRLRCFGEARSGPHSLEMVHPEYHRIQPGDSAGLEETLTPVYPTTEGLNQITWRKLTGQALALMKASPETLQEWLPEAILGELQLPSLAQALEYLHRPPLDASLHRLTEGDDPARHRLVLEELVAHQLSLRRFRHRRQSVQAPACGPPGENRQRFLADLGFSLTGAQRRVVQEIADDLVQPRPMMRLLQGDVGSGKTVVAALAALQAVASDLQVALMAPTEILAEQHLNSFRNWFERHGIHTVWLSGSQRSRARREAIAALTEGRAAVAVGTHALFQGDVTFQRLGLVIIDEQHRFGVHQRMALREKGALDGRVPHQLIMTATPIPRTLAMSAYADLDLSEIDEMPPGRTPVTTAAVPDTRREEVMQRVRAACREGRQAYWVCTLIEESEALQCQAAEDTAAQLAEQLPDLRIGLVHGRMKPAEKEAVMARFKAGELEMLVATTVIEVGVDAPNASLMIIENPERLGLSQLHQLRGRVGRGAVESHCLLMYHPPLTQNARSRIDTLRRTDNGFAIARKDLELRGAGEVLGTRQTGEMQFRLADLLRDQPLIAQAQQIADRILQQAPEAADPLIQRWIGEKTQYIDA